MMQENNPKKVSQMNGEDITQFNIRSFYDHSRRRRTTLAKYIFLLQINKDRERSEHLIKKWGKEKHKPAASVTSTLLKGGKKENKELDLNKICAHVCALKEECIKIGENSVNTQKYLCMSFIFSNFAADLVVI